MSNRRLTGQNVWDEAVDRCAVLYAAGHRLVVSFSGGKDSTATLAVCIEAARRTGRLPVDVVTRDEEVCFPGTYEFIERTHDRPDVNMRWLNQQQPVINVFNRENPYFWVFDDRLKPEEWVRLPPPYIETVAERNIELMNTPKRFPPAEGKTLFSVIGLRVQESMGRRYGLHSSGGYLTGANTFGVRGCRPIYDWTDGDVWKIILEQKLDYNRAYDVFHKFGVQRRRLRIGPPTMNPASVVQLGVAAQAWPKWFDKVCTRLPGVRTAAMFGARAITPSRRSDETWEQCFTRTCIEEAPPWIAERSKLVLRKLLSAHAHHSTSPLPEVAPCYTCVSSLGSWKSMAFTMYCGDPFSVKLGGAARLAPYVEPEFFRAGAGTWGGTPAFS